MSRECPKCGENNLLVRHMSEGELIDSSSYSKVDNEFISASEYDYFWQLKAKKDHLVIVCRTCKYNWRENTKDTE